jgi:hypothetical protein
MMLLILTIQFYLSTPNGMQEVKTIEKNLKLRRMRSCPFGKSYVRRACA